MTASNKQRQEHDNFNHNLEIKIQGTVWKTGTQMQTQE